jgi:hypothetical protein
MKILDRLPLLPQPKTLSFGQRHVPFLRDEIVVWLSIGLPGENDPQRLSRMVAFESWQYHEAPGRQGPRR